MSWVKPIPFHPLGFVPDMPPDTRGAISDASLMFPTASGYRTLPSLIEVAAALPSPVLGLFTSKLSSGGINVFAGTAQHLYRLVYGLVITGNGLTYDQFTAKYGQYGNLPMLSYGDPSFGPPPAIVISGASWVEVDGGQTFAAESWDFYNSGDDVIAVDGVDPDQVFPAAGTQFAPLAGNPPIAKFVVVVDPGAGVSQVTVLANLLSDPTAWAASKPGDDTVWTFNVVDLSATGFIRAEPGPLTGAATVRGLFVLFKADSFYAGSFVGPPYVWYVYPISDQIGTKSNKSIVDIGDQLAFMGPDDFYTFDGTTPTPIPNQLRQWFFGGGQGESEIGIADPLYLDRVEARYDEISAVVYWHFSSINAQPAGALDMYLAWNKKSGRWAPGFLFVEQVLSQFGKSGLTYAQFCNQYQQYSNLPHLTYGDPSFGPAPTRTPAVIGSDGILYSISGPPNSGYVQTGDIGDPIRLTRLKRIRGQFGRFPTAGSSGQRAVLSSFVRRNLGEPLTPFKTNVALSNQGYFDFIEDAGWHTLKIAFQSDAEIQALVPDLEDGGER